MSESHPPTSHQRALLVEDSPVNRIVLSNMLEGMGYQVMVAKNGREAVTKFVDGDFEVILMDVQMPIMDGIAATSIIRQHEFAAGSHTPIIAVTAGMDRETCLDAGMDDHLVKPIRLHMLQQSLQDVAALKV